MRSTVITSESPQQHGKQAEAGTARPLTRQSGDGKGSEAARKQPEFKIMKAKRKYISKATRQLVYEKYSGHCAYCGKNISIDEMQVDHFIPFRNAVHGKNSVDEIESISNLFPSCRLCNWAKRSKSIENFRRYIKNILKNISKTAAYRLAVSYNLIKEFPHKIIFYFESYDKEDD